MIFRKIRIVWLLSTLMILVVNAGQVYATDLDSILGDYIRRPVGADNRQVNIRIERCSSGYCAIGDTYVSRWHATNCTPLTDGEKVGLQCTMRGIRKDETDTFVGSNTLTLENNGSRLRYDYYNLVYDKSGEEYSEVFELERLQTSITGEVAMKSKAASRGLPPEDRRRAESMTDGRYYALIIGVQDYDDKGIDDLTYPVGDAKRLKNLLETKYVFDDIKLLVNPTRSEVYAALEKLQGTLTQADSLLLFYAGHGKFDKNHDQGYWLLKDSTPNGRETWFGNDVLQKYVRAIPSKHTLLISDSCFSGSVIFKTRGISDANKSVQKLFSLPSRKAMTSGTLNQVPDKSMFMKYLVKRLDDNNTEFLPAFSLFSSFRDAVLQNSDNIPQFGNIHNTGAEGGEFIFVKK